MKHSFTPAAQRAPAAIRFAIRCSNEQAQFFAQACRLRDRKKSPTIVELLEKIAVSSPEALSAQSPREPRAVALAGEALEGQFAVRVSPALIEAASAAARAAGLDLSHALRSEVDRWSAEAHAARERWLAERKAWLTHPDQLARVRESRAKTLQRRSSWSTAQAASILHADVAELRHLALECPELATLIDRKPIDPDAAEEMKRDGATPPEIAARFGVGLDELLARAATDSRLRAAIRPELDEAALWAALSQGASLREAAAQAKSTLSLMSRLAQKDPHVLAATELDAIASALAVAIEHFGPTPSEADPARGPAERESLWDHSTKGFAARLGSAVAEGFACEESAAAADRALEMATRLLLQAQKIQAQAADVVARLDAARAAAPSRQATA